MRIKEQYNFENLVNEAERIVFEQLEEQLFSPEYENICKCQDCVLDMAAFALNSLTPWYRVSLMGTLYAHAIEETEYVNEVQKAVKNAIQKISENPAHD